MYWAFLTSTLCLLAAAVAMMKIFEPFSAISECSGESVALQEIAFQPASQHCHCQESQIAKSLLVNLCTEELEWRRPETDRKTLFRGKRIATHHPPCQRMHGSCIPFFQLAVKHDLLYRWSFCLCLCDATSLTADSCWQAFKQARICSLRQSALFVNLTSYWPPTISFQTNAKYSRQEIESSRSHWHPD